MSRGGDDGVLVVADVMSWPVLKADPELAASEAQGRARLVLPRNLLCRVRQPPSFAGSYSVCVQCMPALFRKPRAVRSGVAP